VPATIDRISLDYKSLIVPATLISYGALTLHSDALQSVDDSFNETFNKPRNRPITIDDFTQHAPATAVYALNIAGVRGKHRFIDRTLIFGTSYLIMGASVKVLKNNITVKRPDNVSKNSFPSGHTATAFMGAEFLYQEYKDVSIWYGISGYLVAASTGFLRIHNNKHWFSDVVAGAGIGILSTKIAYWLYPIFKKTFFKNRKNTSAIAMPYYNGDSYGVGVSVGF